jgi:hypothetical protein
MRVVAPESTRSMLRLPTRHVTPAARRNLEIFQATAAAQELTDDARTWDVVAWSWALGPPLRVTLRSERGEVVDFEMDEQSVWRMHANPNVPKEPTPRPATPA